MLQVLNYLLSLHKHFNNNIMSKNKFGAFNVGDKVLFNNEIMLIIEKNKGNKRKKGFYQGGILTGVVSNPCLYKLSNGCSVRGDKLRRIN